MSRNLVVTVVLVAALSAISAFAGCTSNGDSLPESEDEWLAKCESAESEADILEEFGQIIRSELNDPVLFEIRSYFNRGTTDFENGRMYIWTYFRAETPPTFSLDSEASGWVGLDCKIIEDSVEIDW